MKLQTLSLEPDLPEIEPEYRQHYLKEDIRQVSILVLTWMLPYLGFAYIDYLFYGTDTLFFRLLALRASYVLICLLLIYLLDDHIQDYREFDRLTMLWVVCSLTWSMILSLMQPLDYQASLLINLVAVFSFYIFVPNRFFIRVIPPLLYSFFAVFLVLLARVDIRLSTVYAAGFAYIIANVIGILFSTRGHNARRRDYMARREDEKIRSELQRLASTDPLTGVFNRRWLLELAGEAFYRYRRYRRPFTLMVLDMDGFKTVNDTLGHQSGDRMLMDFAQVVAREKRLTDALGRMGGDEFCLIMPETQPAEASALAERLLNECRHLSAKEGALEVSVTVSIGISQVRSEDNSVDSIFARADKALYLSKNSGRDRWQIA